MNQKKAKEIRLGMRKGGVDFRQRTYEWRVRVHPDGRQQYVQRQLAANSGRLLYKQIKRVLANAVSS